MNLKRIMESMACFAIGGTVRYLWLHTYRLHLGGFQSLQPSRALPWGTRAHIFGDTAKAKLCYFTGKGGRRMRIKLSSLALAFAVVSSAWTGAGTSAPKAPASSSKAEDLYKAGSFNEAYEAARQVFTEQPDNVAALEIACRASLAAGEPVAASKALKLLVKKRGTLADYLLLMTACEMAGMREAYQEAALAAESAKEATPRQLYELAWVRGDVDGRLAILRRIAAEFPSAPAGIGPEIAFWEARKGLALRTSAPAIPAEGATLDLTTIWDLEWVKSKNSAGDDLLLLFDAASRMTVLSKDTAERMKLPVIQASFPSPGAYPEEPAPLYTVIDRLDFGPWKVENIPALVVQDEVRLLTFREGRVALKGILGMDLLRGLQVRFDRQKNKLRLFPGDAESRLLLDGDPAGWSEEPAFSTHDQVLVKSTAGQKKSLGILATGAGPVLIATSFIPGTGLKPESKKILDLVPHALFDAHRSKETKLGWLQECLPLVGQVRTIPGMSEIAFGTARFQVKDLPCFPKDLGGDVPIGIVIGKDISDFYALAFDLPHRKMYVKKVLFGK